MNMTQLACHAVIADHRSCSRLGMVKVCMALLLNSESPIGVRSLSL